jgi:uncharacterized protein (TIGR02231 family)
LPNGAKSIVFSFIGLKTQEAPIIGERVDIQMMEDVTQLSEVVTTAYGLSGRVSGVRIRGANSDSRGGYSQPIITTVIENQTTVEIEVKTPYSIKSNGEKLLVELKKHSIDALYQYYAIPKIDKDAFLIARILNWDQYNLLEGEANLYFEDAFVGRSILNAKALDDTLNISLGRDRSIIIGREKVKDYTRRRAIGSNVLESRGFNIIVRNKKSQPINLTLFDQIPVSVINDITVEATSLGGGYHDLPTGKITWELEIAPQQQKELTMQYEVRYPKRERVLLE